MVVVKCYLLGKSGSGGVLDDVYILPILVFVDWMAVSVYAFSRFHKQVHLGDQLGN